MFGMFESSSSSCPGFHPTSASLLATAELNSPNICWFAITDSVLSFAGSFPSAFLSSPSISGAPGRRSTEPFSTYLMRERSCVNVVKTSAPPTLSNPLLWVCPLMTSIM